MFMTSDQLKALLEMRKREYSDSSEYFEYSDEEQREWEEYCAEQETKW